MLYLSVPFFSSTVPGVTHTSTSWEIAIDPNFATIVDNVVNDTVNLTSYTSTLDVGVKTYYARAMFHLDVNGSAQDTLWSNVIQVVSNNANLFIYDELVINLDSAGKRLIDGPAAQISLDQTTGDITINTVGTGLAGTTPLFKSISIDVLGLHMVNSDMYLNGNTLHLNQSGVRSWNIYAGAGDLQIGSGDGLGNVAVNSPAPTAVSHLTRMDFVTGTTVALDGSRQMTGDLTVSKYNPAIHFINTSAPAGVQRWAFITDMTQGNFLLQSLSDTSAYIYSPFMVAHNSRALQLTSTDVLWNSNKIWTAGNDGSASGLDADLLDGQHGSYYTAYADTSSSNILSTANTWSAKQTFSTDLIAQRLIAHGTGGLASNVAVGDSSLLGNTLGTSNTAVGASALQTNSAGSYNTAVGFDALYTSSTASGNTAVGYKALFTNSTGASNTAVGGSALQANSTGNYNTAMGYQALRTNIGGYGNTAVGGSALQANSTGNYNTAMGSSALYTNSTGVANVAVGFHALSTNLNGNYNTAVGYDALLANIGGVDNTAVGGGALQANSTGNYNTAMGSSALQSNTTGVANVAVGFQALIANIGGVDNTAVGASALHGNTSGYDNTAMGYQALFTNSTGYYNTAVGGSALQANSTGDYNTAMGYQALRTNIGGYGNTAVGGSALYTNSTGASNVAVGGTALYTNSTGNNNVGIGVASAASSATVSNEVNIYNGSVTARFQGAASGWSFVSDVRDKMNILDSDIGLGFINAIKPRIFQWSMRGSDVDRGKYQVGFIAQEIMDTVIDQDGQACNLVDSNDPERLTIAQTNLIPVLVKAIQELNTKFEQYVVAHP